MFRTRRRLLAAIADLICGNVHIALLDGQGQTLAHDRGSHGNGATVNNGIPVPVTIGRHIRQAGTYCLVVTGILTFHIGSQSTIGPVPYSFRLSAHPNVH